MDFAVRSDPIGSTLHADEWQSISPQGVMVRGQSGVQHMT